MILCLIAIDPFLPDRRRNEHLLGKRRGVRSAEEYRNRVESRGFNDATPWISRWISRWKMTGNNG